MLRDDVERRSSRARWAVLGTAAAAFTFTAGSFLPPLLEDAGVGWAGWLRLAYAPVCHQLPARSFALGHGVQAVCARCSGLYLGGVAGLFGAVGLVVGRRRRFEPLWLALVAVPTLVDALLPRVGLPALSNLGRALLAAPLGFVAALYLARGIEDLVASLTEPQRVPVEPPDTAGLSQEVLDG